MISVATSTVPITKTEKSRKKRELILWAAARVFKEKGYAQTTLSDIATLANTYSGSMYYYFPSKDHLVEEVLNRATTTLFDAVVERLAEVDPDAGAMVKIRIALGAHLDKMLKRDDFVVAYWKIIDQVPADIRERHNKMPRSYGQFWQKLIDEGQHSGELRSDINGNVVRLLLVGSTIYALMWYDEKGPLSTDEIADVLVEMFFNGVRNREGLSLSAPASAISAARKAVSATA